MGAHVGAHVHSAAAGLCGRAQRCECESAADQAAPTQRKRAVAADGARPKQDRARSAHLEGADVADVAADGHGGGDGGVEGRGVAKAEVDALAGEGVHDVSGVAEQRQPRQHVPAHPRCRSYSHPFIPSSAGFLEATRRPRFGADCAPRTRLLCDIAASDRGHPRVARKLWQRCVVRSTHACQGSEGRDLCRPRIHIGLARLERG